MTCYFIIAISRFVLTITKTGDSRVNDAIGHANFRKIAIFKFITVIRYGENNAYPC